MAPKPGEIYREDVEGPPRPVIVVSREELNRGRYVVAVPVTSAKLEVRWTLPNCVPFQAGQFGFDRDCVAHAEAIGIVNKSDLVLDDGQPPALDGATLRSLVHAIGYAISSECEPL